MLFTRWLSLFDLLDGCYSATANIEYELSAIYYLKSDITLKNSP